MTRGVGRLGCFVAGIGLLALSATGYAVDDCVCQECAGDPVFIQRDYREANMVNQLRSQAVGIAIAKSRATDPTMIVLIGESQATELPR